jgi:hypothetical protein
MHDWMDYVPVSIKEEPSSDSELFMTDIPSSPSDSSGDLFWDCLQPDSGASNLICLENDNCLPDDWQRSPFDTEFILPELPAPRLTCPLVPLRKANPPHSLPSPQPQTSYQQFSNPAYCPPNPVFPTTLLPQAQVFSLPHSAMLPQEPCGVYTFADHFGESMCPSLPQPYRPQQKLNIDISRTLSNVKYSEIFQQYGQQLLVDRHPQFTLQDIHNVLKTGYLYFLKNVKTIVPRIGQEYRFISHVRAPGPGESSDRSYNLLGPIPLRCKVKEWLVGGDLWRMYHFIQGKTAKQSMVH